MVPSMVPSEAAKLAADVSRLKKMVAAKDAQIEALQSRVETLVDDLQEARSERGALAEKVGALEKEVEDARGEAAAGGGQPEVEAPPATDASLQLEFEGKLAAARHQAAAVLAAAEDDFERELELRELALREVRLRNAIERQLYVDELCELELMLVDSGPHMWSQPTQSLISQRVAEFEALASQTELASDAQISMLTVDLREAESSVLQAFETIRIFKEEALHERQKVEAAAAQEQLSLKLEIEELRDQLICQTETELVALKQNGHAFASASSAHPTQGSYGQQVEDLATTTVSASNYIPRGFALRHVEGGWEAASTPQPNTYSYLHHEEEDVAQSGSVTIRRVPASSLSADNEESETRNRWARELRRAGIHSPEPMPSISLDESEVAVIDLPEDHGGSVLLVASPPKVDEPAQAAPPTQHRSQPPLHQLQRLHPTPANSKGKASCKRHSSEVPSSARRAGVDGDPSTRTSHARYDRPLHAGCDVGPCATPARCIYSTNGNGGEVQWSITSERARGRSTAYCSGGRGLLSDRAAPSSLQSVAEGSDRIKSLNGNLPARRMDAKTEYRVQPSRNDDAREQIRQAQAHIYEMLRAQESALRAVADL